MENIRADLLFHNVMMHNFDTSSALYGCNQLIHLLARRLVNVHTFLMEFHHLFVGLGGECALIQTCTFTLYTQVHSYELGYAITVTLYSMIISLGVAFTRPILSNAKQVLQIFKFRSILEEHSS